MASPRTVCFVLLWSLGYSSRKRFQEFGKLSVRGTAADVISALAAAPCPYANSHEAKHIGVNWGAGKDAFAAVQEQLNSLSASCNKEAQTETDIENLQKSIQDAEVNIPTWQTEKAQQEQAVDAYKAAHPEANDAEACKAALSDTRTFNNWLRKAGNFFGDLGHSMKGWFLSAEKKKAHVSAHEAELQERADKEKVLDGKKVLADKCTDRANLEAAVVKKEESIVSTRESLATDKATLAQKKDDLPNIRESIKATASAVVDEIKKVEQEIASNMKE